MPQGGLLQAEVQARLVGVEGQRLRSESSFHPIAQGVRLGAHHLPVCLPGSTRGCDLTERALEPPLGAREGWGRDAGDTACGLAPASLGGYAGSEGVTGGRRLERDSSPGPLGGPLRVQTSFPHAGRRSMRMRAAPGLADAWHPTRGHQESKGRRGTRTWRLSPRGWRPRAV